MHNRARIVAPILLLVALAAAGYWWWNDRAAAANASSQLSGSGTIEAEDVVITAEVAGRVQELLVEEGQEVTAGQVLARLDRALLEAQRDQARAAVAVADANLALLRAGTRPEDIAAAQAQVDAAQAARDGAAAALANAQKMLENPQELQAQVVQAQAARDAAQRNLALLRAGARPEDLAAAESALEQARINAQATRDRLSLAKTSAEGQMRQAADALTQAQARYAQAKSNWEYVQETGRDPIAPSVTNPQTGKKTDNDVSDGQREAYYAQFVQTEAALRQAETAVQQAVAAADSARQAEVTGVQAADSQIAAAEAALAKLRNGATKENLAVAQTALDSAQRALAVAVATRDNPLQLHAAADGAKAQVDAAEAQLAQAQARLEAAQGGARAEQIQAAEAQLAQARAAEHQLDVQLAKTELKAPRAGLVLTRAIHEGEQAAPGAALMTIGSLDSVRLTLYISETDIGRVRQGQQVDVSVDSFPGRAFKGTVSFIAQEAQFTPRNVQTKDERATTVFAVRVDLPNPDHALKPGMPADATIIE
jgi:multidrug resistance efflux pump